VIAEETLGRYFAEYSDSADFAEGPAIWGGKFGDLLMMLIPASQFLEVRIVGRLFAPDIVLLVLLPLLLASRRAALSRQLPLMFIVFGIGWLCAQVATDFIRGTPFEDYSRGWAMIAITLTNFSALYLLIGHSSRRIVLFTLGDALGAIMTYRVEPGGYAVNDPWKFGYGYAVTLVFVVVSVFLNRRRRKMLTVAALIIPTALNLYYGFRSLAGECFIAAAYLLIARLKAFRKGAAEASSIHSLLVCIMLTFAAAGLLRIYSYCAESGLLGYAAWHKYEIQSSGRYGVLIGGRAEFLTGLEAAMESPVVGHGSWAKDWRYSSRQEVVLSDFGYQVGVAAPDSWIIPTHSYLVGAWVDAGVIGALFWVWVLSIPVRSLARLDTAETAVAPLIAFFATALIWDILFSPYGADRRFTTPFVVVALMQFLETR
jgi:hypothetical protein